MKRSSHGNYLHLEVMPIMFQLTLEVIRIRVKEEQPCAHTGRLTGLGAADDAALAAEGLTGSNVMAGAVREVITPLAEQAAAGALKVDIVTVLPLEQAADGLATIASGRARGKIVVKVSD